jgi:osmoprotectant transport system permease protein
MILVRGVVAGLGGVDAALVDAARGLGLTARQTLLRVEFPAALPVILGGVRVATVSLIALATVAAWINAGGLGVLLFEGIGTDNPDKIVAGALAAAALAIAADLLLRGAERAVRT